MTDPGTIWDVLGVAPDADRDTLRRAYARLLRGTHPEDDPEGFKRLRAAYELALGYIDHGAGRVEAEGEMWSEPSAFRAEPVAPPLPGVPEPGEVSALFGAREAERAQLHAAMRDLDTALRGNWRASDAELEALFHDVLAAPAMVEIVVQDEAEAWAAELIAANIPRSDAILLAAVQRFGWSADGYHATSWAVGACLARIEEWRIIAELGGHRHPLNPAWRSLTRPAGAWWSWRLDALRPGVADGVEALLGRRDEIAPGLAFSFKPDSVARWEALLARPHLTPAMLATVPFAAFLAFMLGTSLNPDRDAAGPSVAGWWALLAAALIAPMLLFALHAVRLAAGRRTLPAAARDGWIWGYVALGPVAALLPVSPWSVAAFGVVALAVWGWMTATTQPPTRREWLARAGALWLPVGGAALAGSIALIAIPVPRALVLVLMLVLYLALRFGGWSAGIAELQRVLRGPGILFVALGLLLLPVLGMTIVTAAGSGRASAALVHGLRVPAYGWFYAGILIWLAALPVLAAAQSMPRQPARIARIALVALLVAAWFVALASLPGPRPAPGHRAPPPSVRVDDAVPGALAAGTLRGDTVAALGDGSTDRALAALAERQPGFAQIERGNPALYRDVRAAAASAVGGRQSAERAADRIVALIAASYHDRLPRTTDALVREEFAIRLARLWALARESDGACVTPRWQLDELTLYDAGRRRQTAQALNVASNPQAADRGRRESRLAPADLDARAAATAGDDVATYRRNLAGGAGAGRQCAAMIARLQALNGNIYQTDPDLVTTMRDDLLHEQATQPRPLE